MAGKKTKIPSIIDYKKLGMILKAVRKKRFPNLTAAEFAAMLITRNVGDYCWSEYTILNIESGHGMSIERLLILAPVLGIDPFQVLSLCSYGCNKDWEWILYQRC